MAIFNTLRLTSIALAISIIPLAYSAEYALVADYLIDGYSDQLHILPYLSGKYLIRKNCVGSITTFLVPMDVHLGRFCDHFY